MQEICLASQLPMTKQDIIAQAPAMARASVGVMAAVTEMLQQGRPEEGVFHDARCVPMCRMWW